MEHILFRPYVTKTRGQTSDQGSGQTFFQPHEAHPRMIVVNSPRQGSVQKDLRRHTSHSTVVTQRLLTAFTCQPGRRIASFFFFFFLVHKLFGKITAKKSKCGRGDRSPDGSRQTPHGQTTDLH